MEHSLYVMFIQRGKTYNKITRAIVEQHVAHIRSLDDSGQLELCGVLKGYPGVAGMVILRAASLEEADALCRREPLVTLGYATYKLCPFQAGNKENNFLL